MTGALLLAVWLWGIPPYLPPAAPPDERADRLAAIERCRQGYANANPASLSSLPADLARACADLYREPACSAAMRNPPKDQFQFAAAVITACRDAYCPRLPAPRPKVCASADLPPPIELLAQWGVLQQHILAFEMGADPKTVPPLFQPVSVAMPRNPPKAAPPRSAIVKVWAASQGNGQVRLWIENGQSTVVRESVVADAAASLAHDARATAPPGARVEFGIDKRLPHGLVVSLIEAFKQEGFDKFSIAVEPAK